ncbi:LysR substrate-binding domain-containing protein [Phaeobacter porticola]|uniref:HTH-type transcriptional regulator, LysR type n=1 Tax=Phaeobacter porticola TaxID=1844006 RepID=A0A1L3I6S4_9RHOB|nr:LysR substrate-binding domain-containing protein [Phaeobacter porticola]APG47722.1 HTH-type transcriptional regulator, LysR type [Phaeobacter porticola]
MAVAPSRPKGPPMTAMRAFEAAARLQSFVAAADELGVSAGAVSQQVKALEGWVGTPLFRRNPQGVVLTAAGRALLPSFIAAFDAMGAATQILHSLRPSRTLHIATLPCIAQLWLPSRLRRLRGLMPDLKISVTALETPPNLARELFDFALFFAPHDCSDAECINLGSDTIYPVCAPCLAEQLNTPRDLNDVALLQDQSWALDWSNWATAAGVALDDAQGGPRYSLYSLAMQEAEAGAGVLMGHHSLVADALAAHRLVRPYQDLCCDTGKALILFQPPTSRRSNDHSAIADLLCSG